jgi:hypothetical protein
LTRAKATADLISVSGGLGYREQHPLLVQFGQPQHVRLPLRPMSRLKAAGKILLHTLWRTPFVQPTTG